MSTASAPHDGGREGPTHDDQSLLTVDGPRPWLRTIYAHLRHYTPSQSLFLVALGADTYAQNDSTEPGHDKLATFTSLDLSDLSTAVNGLLLPRPAAPFDHAALMRPRRGRKGARAAYVLTLPDPAPEDPEMAVDGERPATGLLSLLPRLDLTLSDRLVLTTLTLLSIDGAEVAVTTRRLAHLCGISRTTAVQAIARLTSHQPKGTPGAVMGRPPLLLPLAPTVGQRPARYRLDLLPSLRSGDQVGARVSVQNPEPEPSTSDQVGARVSARVGDQVGARVGDQFSRDNLTSPDLTSPIERASVSTAVRARRSAEPQSMDHHASVDAR
ncbi:hypothetical protein CFK38_14740 [Brachybacterium vulturis]|uniref:Uncharacterized protein n=1 Tax=Brachybacterium vulturis TaxID=2017484 RepID=A0A291GQW9_9MICO|nr:hypothetical protein [Brachybacterium vulturis]ATG52641.1 hypothetical protein CFK38_14740 [Brachybacterium vulturis]